MASHSDFAQYVVEQLGAAGALHARKMFGEYGLYCGGIFFALICDDQLFIKITAPGEAAFPGLPKAPPYKGAKEYFLVEDVDDPTVGVTLTRITCEALRQGGKP